MSRTCCLWLLVSLPPSMTFHPQPEVMQPFFIIWHKHLLSSLHLLQLFGSILFPGQMAYLTFVATACWFMWSIGVILTFFDDLKTFLTLLAIAGNVLYQTQLNSASSSWSSLIYCFCSSFIPTYCVSTLTFRKDGAMSQSADTADADADADEDVDVVLGSLCFFMSSHHC